MHIWLFTAVVIIIISRYFITAISRLRNKNYKYIAGLPLYSGNNNSDESAFRWISGNDTNRILS